MSIPGDLNDLHLATIRSTIAHLKAQEAELVEAMQQRAAERELDGCQREQAVVLYWVSTAPLYRAAHDNTAYYKTQAAAENACLDEAKRGPLCMDGMPVPYRPHRRLVSAADAAELARRGKIH